MLRPLLVANFSTLVGGGEQGFLDLAVGMKRRGIKFRVVIPDRDPSGIASPISLGDELRAREIPFDSSPRGIPVMAHRLREIARENNLVYVTGARGLVAASLAHTGLPLVWHARVASRDKLDPLLSRLPDLIIANSQATAARFSRRDRVKVLPNGVRTPRTGLPGILPPLSTPRLGVIGRMTPEKGHLDLLPALEILLRNEPQLSVVFAGHDEGMVGDQVRSFAARYSRNVALMGFIPEISDHLDEFSLIVIPSRVEGFGRVAAEALGAGVMVAARPVGGLLEVLEGVPECLLPDSPSAWPERIVELVKHPPYSAERLRKEGERFRVEAHIDALLAEFLRLVSGEPS